MIISGDSNMAHALEEYEKGNLDQPKIVMHSLLLTGGLPSI